MTKHVIKILLVFYCILPHSLSQDKVQVLNESDNVKLNSTKSIISVEPFVNESLHESQIKSKSEELYRYSFDLLQKSKVLKEERTFNIVSSFRQNIRFGGFWDRYAIVNFTPDMYIKPFDFLSVYAVHNSSYFIPVKAIKEHFRLLAIQSAAILVIDNSVKHLMQAGKMIRTITGFLLKNIVINTLLDDILSRGSDRIFEQGSYYCAVSIRF
ncbi:MAG: hypothetical protein HY965_07650 [Ignavibacteriales bacterium]|nr:hypothetical protein [Ignavibacteriales bacterium]